MTPCLRCGTRFRRRRSFHCVGCRKALDREKRRVRGKRGRLPRDAEYTRSEDRAEQLDALVDAARDEFGGYRAVVIEDQMRGRHSPAGTDDGWTLRPRRWAYDDGEQDPRVVMTNAAAAHPWWREHQHWYLHLSDDEAYDQATKLRKAKGVRRDESWRAGLTADGRLSAVTGPKPRTYPASGNGM